MPAHFLIVYWKKELQVFYKNLLLLQKGSGSEAIHDLRVSIKKLRSYFRLYSAVFTKTSRTSFPASLRNLFSILGRQRNNEICIELLHRFQTKQLISLKKHFE